MVLPEGVTGSPVDDATSQALPGADDDVSLAGKAVIVTGASRGIGRGIAHHLARRGARVTITGRKEDRLRAVGAELEELGAEVVVMPGDIADRDAVQRTAAETRRRFGRIDGLVNNAQSFRPVMPLEDVQASDMDRLLDTGPKATLWAMQAVLPAMREQGFGRIVNFGSVNGVRGQAGYGPYAASKEAIRALTRTAAQEWGRYGIVVNCVIPSSMAHRLPPEDPFRKANFDAMLAAHPMQRDGDAEHDIAPVVAFLLSNGCRYVTGETIMAIGGGYMRA